MPTLSIDMRPKTLDEMLGNEPVLKAVKAQLASGRWPVAWLFAGPPGVGKTTLALILARMYQKPGFEGEPDITEVNASDLNGVDDARGLARTALYGPLVGDRKVIILDEAQRLTEPAQNVLLKAFETNAPTVWFICTTDPAKLLPALRSRCQTFFLRGLDANATRTLVIRALGATNQATDPNINPLIDALTETNTTAPRDILMAVERWTSGLSTNQAVQVVEDVRPDFLAIAKATVAGNWNKVRSLLPAIKAADALALRGMVASYLKTMLLDSEPGPRASVYATAITFAFRYTEGFSAGTTWPGTVAWLYVVCDSIDFAKRKQGGPA
jgi:replication factor C small subunit